MLWKRRGIIPTMAYIDPDPDHGAGRDAVELYTRTYGTLLRSSGETKLKVLEQSHIGMGSSLHPRAGSAEPDTGALIYALRRLPPSLTDVIRIDLGQSADVFKQMLNVDVERWEMQSAPGRRRRYYFDGKETLAVYIASPSDIDDVIPQLVALQIEWNKLHKLLAAEDLNEIVLIDNQLILAERLGIAEADWMRLVEIWGTDLPEHLRKIQADEKSFSVRMLGGTQVGYVKATRRWWEPIRSLLAAEGLVDRPIYFVSSNTHSLVNLLSGSARRHQEEILAYIEATNNLELVPELRKLRQGQSRGNWDNFLYYAARIFYGQGDAQRLRATRTGEGQARGIFFLPSQAGLDLAAQVIVLDRLTASDLDPRLGSPAGTGLRASPSVVININYPLGLG